MILALIFLSLAVVCRAINELYYHGKLKWQNEKKPLSFFGEKCDLRKYKLVIALGPFGTDTKFPAGAPDNWYYKFFKIKYKERWPTSTTLTVALTDGPHFMQFMFFNFLSLSITFALGFQWLTLGLVWGLIHVIHFLVYRLLSK